MPAPTTEEPPIRIRRTTAMEDAFGSGYPSWDTLFQRYVVAERQQRFSLPRFNFCAGAWINECDTPAPTPPKTNHKIGVPKNRLP